LGCLVGLSSNELSIIVVKASSCEVIPVMERIAKKGPPPKYPYDDWFKTNEYGDGEIVDLFRWKDFDTTPDHMRPLLHQVATRRGGWVECSVNGDQVRFQFHKGQRPDRNGDTPA
jgi:hypothetical protein